MKPVTSPATRISTGNGSEVGLSRSAPGVARREYELAQRDHANTTISTPPERDDAADDDAGHHQEPVAVQERRDGDEGDDEEDGDGDDWVGSPQIPRRPMKPERRGGVDGVLDLHH
jgi:hypothetical protein